MRPLAGLERFLERLFERPGTRLFRPAVQPIQIQRRVERAMELGRRPDAGRMRVPGSFVVRLHPTDLPPDQDGSRTLAADLADAALRFARDHRYVVPARPTVALIADPAIRRGEVDVRAADDPASAPAAAAAAGADQASSTTPGSPQPAPEPDRPSPQPPDVSAAAGEGTAEYVVPRARIPATVLRSISPAGPERRHDIAAAQVTIGRAPDNDVVLHDRRVSRHHARLTARAGGLIFSDLDSTNGSVVNGIRVREVALGPGDRIDIGRSVLFVESVGEGAGVTPAAGEPGARAAGAGPGAGLEASASERSTGR